MLSWPTSSSALADEARGDKLVYHGLAGHLLLKGVPHVLKVRIIADMEARVAAEMAREDISDLDARLVLEKDDSERRKWTQHLYGVDPWDASLYDLVIHIHKLTVDDAVEFIVQATERSCFQTTPEAQRKMDDLALACRIKAALVQQECYDLEITSEYGNVVIYTTKGGRHGHHMDQKLESLRQQLPEINHLEVREGLAAPANAV